MIGRRSAVTQVGMIRAPFGVGANVKVADGKIGTITDIDGAFKLDVPPGTKLIVSFIGQQVIPT